MTWSDMTLSHVSLRPAIYQLCYDADTKSPQLPPVAGSNSHTRPTYGRSAPASHLLLAALCRPPDKHRKGCTFWPSYFTPPGAIIHTLDCTKVQHYICPTFNATPTRGYFKIFEGVSGETVTAMNMIVVHTWTMGLKPSGTKLHFRIG